MKRSWLLTPAVALGLAAPAEATFPGENGRIAYTWSRGGEAFESGPTPRLVGVVSTRPDGGDRRIVARHGRDPAYSPDGRRIAFRRGHRLWITNADGAGAVPVTPRGWLVDEYEWSPGGTRLVFDRGFVTSVRSVLYTVGPDGTELQRLLKARLPLSLSSGAWSPDGKAIVYGQASALNPLVRVFRAGHITTLARPAHHPTWSRTGLIAYDAPVTGEDRSQVCLIRRGLDAPLRCIGFADASITDPSWSPSGRRLMVMRTPRDAGAAELWTVRPDGTVLTRTPRPNGAFPIFSPNGRLLAYSLTRFAGPPAQRLGFTDLLTQRLDGTRRRLIVRGGQAQAPDWQPVRTGG
jgi:Tol biopolymer transport system component